MTYRCIWNNWLSSKIGTILFLLLSVASASSQAPTFGWVQISGGNGTTAGNAVATDASGNIFVAGGFERTNIVFGATVLTNHFVSDMFLVKYSADGDVLWARQAGATGYSFPSGIACDSGGNVYVIGQFGNGGISFGSTILTNSLANTHFFVAKYDPAGNPLLAVQSSGNGYESGSKIAVDSIGNFYVTGRFGGTNCTFGTNVFDTSQPSPSEYDIFIAKYDALGNVLWAKRAGSESSDWATGIGVDAAGNCHVAGSFSGSNMYLGNISLNRNGYNGIFLAKYDQQGTLVWAKGAGGDGSDSAGALAVDSAGNSYLAGSLGSATAAFDHVTITNHGLGDAFVARYDNAGNVLWAISCGGTKGDNATDITLDSSGNPCVLGSLKSTNSFFGNIILTNSNGAQQMFVVALDTNGSPIWARQTIGNNELPPRGIAVDAELNLYTVGIFYGPATFGNTTLVTSHVSMFLAKLERAPTLKIAFSAGELRLSWPATQTGFVLESATSADGTWTEIANAVSVIGDLNVVVETASGNGKFYRLRKP